MVLPKFLPILFESPVQLNNSKQLQGVFQANPEIEPIHEYILDTVLSDPTHFNTRNVDVSMFGDTIEYLVEMKSVPLVSSLWIKNGKKRQQLLFNCSINLKSKQIVLEVVDTFMLSFVFVNKTISLENSQEAIEKEITDIVSNALIVVEKNDRQKLNSEIAMVANVLTQSLPNEKIDLLSIEAVIRQVVGRVFDSYRTFVWPVGEESRGIRQIFFDEMEKQKWEFDPVAQVFTR